MPNSISQGACQQPGLGFETRSRCDGSGAPGHPALPLPTPWLRARRCALPRHQRAHPPRPGAQKPREGRGREATTPADSIHYNRQEIRNCSKRLTYSVSGSFPRQVEDPKALWPEEGPLPQNSRDPRSPPSLA
ncbi:hypothetical protein QTO34_007161, partial [Cnephaeus nilssonii]